MTLRALYESQIVAQTAADRRCIGAHDGSKDASRRAEAHEREMISAIMTITAAPLDNRAGVGK
jgi:hypothetical protein